MLCSGAIISQSSLEIEETHQKDQYLCLLRFLDVETNAGPRRPAPAVGRILCSNVLGLAGNLCDLTLALSQYDKLLCSETLVSDMHHALELLVPGFGLPFQGL